MKKNSIIKWCLLVFIVWAAYWIVIRCSFNGDIGKSGQFGDTFGALNTLLTGLAFVVVLDTLIQQSQEIQETKRDAEDDRRLRLMLNLYDKRFRVYQATLIFISNVIFDLGSESIGQEQMARFDTARDEAYFLFAGETDLLNYLDELREKSKDYAIWRSQAKGKGVGSEESKQRDKINEWFYSQLHRGAKAKFVPYLSFPEAGTRKALD